MGLSIGTIEKVAQYVEKLGVKSALDTNPISKINFGGLKIAPQLPSDVASFTTKTSENCENIFESSSLNKLFSNEFKPIRQFDERGNKVTTIIDKTTGKPVEAVIEYSNGEYLFHAIKGSGESDYLGSIKISSNEKDIYGFKGTYIHNMNTQAGNAKYAGTGVRMHQLAIEDSIEHGTNGQVFFQAAWDSPGFHYKSGFRPIENLKQMPNERKLMNLCEGFDLNEARLNLSDAIKISNGQKMLDLNVFYEEANIRQCLLMNEKVEMGSVHMNLRGEQLLKWKERIAMQPILG